MTQNPPALPSTDGPQNWRALRTQESAGLAAWIFMILVIPLMIGSGGFFAFLGLGAREAWLSWLLLGTGTFMMVGTLWCLVWNSQHGGFNFDLNQKTKRIRKWKTSLFLERSFDEYDFDEFRAVRSVQTFGDDDIHWVVVELLFKAAKPALEVARFGAIGRGASFWQRCGNTLRGLRTESPGGAALRQELVKLMGITDAGYFDKER